MRRGSLISVLSTVALFILLEVLSMMMIARGGIAQRYRVLSVVNRISYSAWSSVRGINYFFDYKQENEKLSRENLELRNRLSAYESAMYRQDSTWREGRYTYSLARVVKNSVNSQHNSIILNKGELDGVTKGCGVISDDGVVGVVSAVTDHYCRVESFLNVSQRVSAKIAGSGSFGLLRWSGRAPDKAILSEIPTHATVSAGDTVSTSGFSAIYPADIPLGVVESMRSDGVALEIKVNLFQDYNSLQHVYIVFDAQAEAIKKLNNEK